jgi:hypothetical protein
MTILTPELKQEIEKARGNPLRLEDPQTHATYVLLKAEDYDRLKPDLRSEEAPTEQVPEGIQRSKAAFLRDLPGLLARKRLHGRWVLYKGNAQIGISRRADKLLRKAHKLGMKNEEFYLGAVEPHSTEPEEIEHSLFEYEELDEV